MADLIKPRQHGQVLVNDIANTTLGYGQLAIWWTGQSGYIIKSASTLFGIDLYLSEHLTHKYAGTEKPHIRMTKAPLRGMDLRGIQWVFSTHKHSDHLDPGSLPDLLDFNPEARMILPLALVDYAVGLGLDRERFIPTRGDETLNVGPLTVHVIPAAHPGLDHDEDKGYLFVSYVVEVDGVTIYHSGDTLAYEGLAKRLQPYAVDIAFLPINGTDERRKELHVPPNMNIEEALQLASAIANPLVIPHHYDMFTFNTVDVTQFIEKAEAAAQPYRVLHCGEKFIWPE